MLLVWADSRIAGALDRHDSQMGDFLFTYGLQVPEQSAVSLTMPVSLESYSFPGLHPVFQMNMPEGRLREVLEKRFRKVVQGFDELSLLEITGRSQIGRLRYGNAPPPKDAVPLQSVQEILTYSGSEDLFEDLVNRFAAVSGISGVQPKVLVRDEDALSGDGRSSLTVKGATHIVKSWDPEEYPELAANEFFCLTAARRAGLDVPHFELSQNGRFLVVERFDLSADGEYLGFEDCCVLNGLPAAEKYELSYEAVAKTLKRYVSPVRRPEALDALFRSVALSCALRNGDAHLKNYGVLYRAPGEEVFLSPAYDIVSTTPYLPKDVMALMLDGRKSFPSAKVLLRFAQVHCGIEPEKAAAILQKVAQTVVDTLPELDRYASDRPEFGPMAQKMKEAWSGGLDRSLKRESKGAAKKAAPPAPAPDLS
ncbi:MAG: type II toxin-antitoxin system HipA family toxin [Pseudogulbenkiania sp.]|nr:type II toxin-antitoxin system HipA family toxin [Pseudogulbenkiania sp.]